MPDQNPFERPFHVITLLDVLEHVEDDQMAVRKLSSWLAPQGMMLIAVPAFQWLWSGEDVVSEHKRSETV